MSQHIIVRTPSLLLPDDSQLRRGAAGPVEDYDPAYLAKMDEVTVFFDAIRSGDEVTLIGPPFRNLLGTFEKVRVTDSAGNSTDIALETQERPRGQFSTIPVSGEEVTISFPNWNPDVQITPTAAQHDLFAGKRVVHCISKNNALEWMRDWAIYYRDVHRVNAVTLYDNGSDEYTLEDISAVFASIDGIDVSAVVDWPFIFGPQAEPWDSDFTHVGSFNDTLHRFLRDAEGMIQADLDELVLPVGGLDLFEALGQSDRGVIYYDGLWVENVRTDGKTDVLPRVYDQYKLKKKGTVSVPKYALAPAKLPADVHMTHHVVHGVERKEFDERFQLSHFRAITTGWRFAHRTVSVAYTPEDFTTDLNLVRFLQQAFPEEVTPKLQQVMAEAMNEFRAQSQNVLLDGDQISSTALYTFIKNANRKTKWRRSWVYEDRLAVFEFKTPRSVYAADVVSLSEGRISLNLVARKIKSDPELRQALIEAGFTGKVLSQPEQPLRLELAIYKPQQSFEEIAKVSEEISDNLVRIQKLVIARDTPASAKPNAGKPNQGKAKASIPRRAVRKLRRMASSH